VTGAAVYVGGHELWFLSTPAGLIVGSDTTSLGHEYHARLGMFPLG
jgi:hypothetical protein